MVCCCLISSSLTTWYYLVKQAWKFCYFSGHKVNSFKSKIFFSSNIGVSIKKDIGNLLGFQQTEDLGNYLGVPLFHTRTKNSTFHFIIDKDKGKLNFCCQAAILGRQNSTGKISLAYDSWVLHANSDDPSRRMRSDETFCLGLDN